MRFYLLILAVLFSFYSCNTEQIHNIDISNIEVDFEVKRFDVDFYTSEAQSLQDLKIKYPYFFPIGITDSITLLKIASKEEQELFLESQKIYQKFVSVKNKLETLFKNIKYYNSRFNAPDFVTMLTNIDYDSRVIYADSLLIVSLDVYLGKEHHFYADYPKYIKENNTKEHLIVDVATAIIGRQFSSVQERSFVAKMIHEGKKMYLLDLYLPGVSDKEKIGYEVDKLSWVKANEEEIWSYFIEKEILFSTNVKLDKRFLDIGPFSKFYSQQDNLSPGRVGVWMGWQIVRAYMNHNNVPLQDLIKINEIDLYNKSKYKPRK
jgi:gliding motility-associated lipoprotein GldB